MFFSNIKDRNTDVFNEFPGSADSDSILNVTHNTKLISYISANQRFLYHNLRALFCDIDVVSVQFYDIPGSYIYIIGS